MKAIRIHNFGGPEVLKLEQLNDPRADAGQIVVRTRAIGVNPVETYIRSGIYGQRQFPFTPGTDAAGVVEAVGDGVKSFKPNDRVYINGSVSGAYAELILCNESQVHVLPKSISFQQGAAIGVPYGTAHRAFYHRGQAQPGETVLVHGATGGVGIAAVQLARAAGLTVIGTGGSEAGRRLVMEEGAHHVLDHHKKDYLQEVLTLTDGKGVNLILEMLANVNLGKDLTVLAKYGRVVVIGSRGAVEINPRDGMGKDADIRAMTLMNATEADLKGIHAHLIAGLANGTLRPVIDKEIPLADAAQAHTEIMQGESHGKIVLIP